VPDYRVIELSSFEALQEAVVREGLGDETQPSEFFYTAAWFSNLADFGLSSEGLLLLLVLGPEKSVALCLPLQHSRQGLTSVSNYYSSLFGPITWGRPITTDAAIWQVIARHLRQQRWPVISISPLDTDAPCYRGLNDALRNEGYAVDDFFCFGNWYLNVAERSFADYAQTLPSALRNSIARGQRRLTKQGEWSIHIQSQVDDLLEASIQAFVHVYQHSWKQPEPHAQFIPQLVRTAANQAWLRLGILSLKGRAIAAQLWLVKDGKASIYKLAYLEGFERLSAGSVLTHALMQHAVDSDGVHEVDYLTGDDAYKQDWMSHRRERRGLVAFDTRTINGLWTCARHFGGKLLKR